MHVSGHSIARRTADDGCRRLKHLRLLDRVRHVDEHVADAEPARQRSPRRAHAEGLGRVVAGREEVDAGLARARP